MPGRLSIARLVRRDPERRVLRALGERLRDLPARRRPDQSLQVVADLARELTGGRYAALSVTDEHDVTEGFFASGLTAEQMARLRTPPQGHGPLGSLRYDGKPVRFDDVQQHAKAFGFPSHHPEMAALVGVAIWVHGSVRGALYVTDRRDGHAFDEHDERVLLTLAEHAAKVIETEWY
ncbi:MAG: GAF domain-containing protein [Chloroflexi bacterium]|nr:GAF domain-containing protein [Chloroflexota bacterium]MDA1241206.1 GAF domain-containing protein [Chloroflexota bacterium]